MSIRVSTFLVIPFLFGFALVSTASAQVEAVADVTASSIVLDDASSLLSSKIGEAKDAGKEVELEFYKTIMQSLDRIRDLVRSSSDDLNKSVDNSLRKASTDLSAIVRNTDEMSRARMLEVMIALNSLNQTIADVLGVKDRQIVTMVWPTVVKQQRAGDVIVTVLGVGLADLDSITLKIDGKEFEPATNIGNTIEFAIPHSAFAHKTAGQKIFKAMLILNSGWFSWNKEVPVAFKVLPNKIASFTINPHVAVTERSYSDTRSVPFTKLSGRDGRRSVTVKPSQSDWRIDTSSIQIKKIGGEKSSDMRFEGLPTELGFVIYSDMGHIKKGLSKRPGWATFSYSWREFKDEASVKEGVPVTGELKTVNGAASYKLANQTQYVAGTITDFTGRTYAIAPGRTTYGWVRVDHVKASNSVIVESDL